MGWAIERDGYGVAVRLYWCGLEQPPLDLRGLQRLCPRCRSERWQDLRCLDCWYHAADVNWGVPAR